MSLPQCEMDVSGQHHASAVLHKEKLPVPTYVEAGWVPGLVWMCSELRKSPSTGIRTVIRKMSLLLSPAQSM